MIIEVVDALFEDPGYTATLDLYQLFRLGWSTRHILLVEPAYDEGGGAAINRWLARQAEDVAELFADILDVGNMRFAAELSRVTLVVEAEEGPPAWDSRSGYARHSVSLARAVEVAGTPLRLLVENRRNDAAFLRACVPHELAGRFAAAEDQGWIRFEHAGGLGEMFHRVEEAGMGGAEAEALRLSVIHDSDARAAFDNHEATRFDTPACTWGPPRDNARLAEACAAAVVPIDHHQLSRRAIENYLPGAALRRWANSRDRARRRAQLSAFMSMSQEQRDYFNMKHGLGGDEKSTRGLCPIYVDLDDNTRRVLTVGFGDSIAGLFGPDVFAAEDGWRGRVEPELRPVIQAIFERM